MFCDWGLELGFQKQMFLESWRLCNFYRLSKVCWEWSIFLHFFLCNAIVLSYTNIYNMFNVCFFSLAPSKQTIDLKNMIKDGNIWNKNNSRVAVSRHSKELNFDENFILVRVCLGCLLCTISLFLVCTFAVLFIVHICSG